jgi:hypothetical protein
VVGSVLTLTVMTIVSRRPRGPAPNSAVPIKNLRRSRSVRVRSPGRLRLRVDAYVALIRSRRCNREADDQDVTDGRD